MSISCSKCGSVPEDRVPAAICPKCGEVLGLSYNLSKFKSSIDSQKEGIWRFEDILPSIRNHITLGEGRTPLRKLQRIFSSLDLELYLKDESFNPTSSFRDRSSVMMVSHALDLEFSGMVCASNGNEAASLSAYCAVAGIECTCVLPKTVHLGKLAQIHAHGGKVVGRGKTVDEAITHAEKLAREENLYQATPELNFFTVEAQRTIAFEIVLEFMSINPNNDDEITVLAPMGSGSLIYSLWRGFEQAKEAGWMESVPRLVGVQTIGFDPISAAFVGDSEEMGQVKTSVKGQVATAILVREPLFGKAALKAIRETQGTSISVSGEEIVEAARKLARMEGIFAEPSSASILAAVPHLKDQGILDHKQIVVGILTSSGLKAPRAIPEVSTERPRAFGLSRTMSTKMTILETIASGQATFGYGIWKELGERMTLQAVYQHLTELEERDLISENVGDELKKDRRKNFEITPKGRRVLDSLEDLFELFS